MLPPKVQAVLQAGIAAQQAGRVIDAAAHYERVRVAAPWCFDGWHLGGMAALLLGRADDAVRLLFRALQLKPGTIHTQLGLGVARLAMGDPAGAEEILLRVVHAQPALAEAWHHLGFARQSAGRLVESVEAHRRATSLKPGDPRLWHAQGVALDLLARDREAQACFERAAELDPHDARARLGRALSLFKSHRVDEAVAEYEAAIARDPQLHVARSHRLMALNSSATRSREELFAEHIAAGRAMGDAPARHFPNDPDPARRLRVGFISPDFREHSVAYFVEPLLRHLDRDGFEVVLYHDHPQVDAVSERLRGLAAHWRTIAGRTDAMVETAILADAPDVLVDLAGHTGQNRLPLLARRLAPVQVNYLGYPNTTGVTAIDYRFVDAWTDPPGAGDELATERLVRLVPTAWTYEPRADAPEPAAPPCTLGAPVTFGSFNNFTKATDPMLRTWAAVLDGVPGSRLLIKAVGLDDPAVAGPVRARLRAAGLGDERVELLGAVRDPVGHLALYSRVDVALDMFPYHGTTTTCEALWMGVPVITLAGDRHASLVGVSLLSAVGHPEWIASMPEDYVRLATALATEPRRLASLRTGLREELRRSPLLDHAGQAMRFGAALRDCWRQWCRAHAPVSPAPSQPELLASS